MPLLLGVGEHIEEVRWVVAFANVKSSFPRLINSKVIIHQSFWFNSTCTCISSRSIQCIFASLFLASLFVQYNSNSPLWYDKR